MLETRIFILDGVFYKLDCLSDFSSNSESTYQIHKLNKNNNWIRLPYSDELYWKINKEGKIFRQPSYTVNYQLLEANSATGKVSLPKTSGDADRDLGWFFYALSCLFSFLILSQGGGFAFWMVFIVPFYALWLNLPFWVLLRDSITRTGPVTGYFIWVVIQWAIFYYGLTPPSGMGIPLWN